MMATWPLWAKLLTALACLAAGCGVSYAVAKLLAKASESFSDYCRNCGESLGQTTVQDGTGRRFCCVACRTLTAANKKVREIR